MPGGDGSFFVEKCNDFSETKLGKAFSAFPFLIFYSPVTIVLTRVVVGENERYQKNKKIKK